MTTNKTDNTQQYETIKQDEPEEPIICPTCGKETYYLSIGVCDYEETHDTGFYW